MSSHVLLQRVGRGLGLQHDVLQIKEGAHTGLNKECRCSSLQLICILINEQECNQQP